MIKFPPPPCMSICIKNRSPDPGVHLKGFETCWTPYVLPYACCADTTHAGVLLLYPELLQCAAYCWASGCPVPCYMLFFSCNQSNHEDRLPVWPRSRCSGSISLNIGELQLLVNLPCLLLDNKIPSFACRCPSTSTLDSQSRSMSVPWWVEAIFSMMLSA